MIGTTLDFASTDRYVVGETSGLATLEYVGGRTQSGSGTTSNIQVSLAGLTGGTDTSPQENDIVVIAIELCGSSDKTYRISGYTQIVDLYANDTEDSNLQVGYKFMGATPDASVTISGGTGSSSDAYAIVVHVWRNVDQTTPLDVTPTTISQNNTGIPNPPAITPVTNNAVILVAAGTAHTGGTDTFSAGYLDNFITVGGNDDSDATIGMGSVVWTGGTYDPNVWGFSQSDSTAFSTNSVTIALRPATITIPVFGNYKNSGIWNLSAVFDSLYIPSSSGITFLSSTSGSITSTIDLPTGLQEGDLVVVFGFQDNTIATPSTWNQAAYNIGDFESHKTIYKFMGTVPDTSVTFGVSNGVYIAAAFRGVDQTTPLDNTPTNYNSTSPNAAIDPSAITTVTNGSFVLYFGGTVLASSSYINGVSTGYTAFTPSPYGSSQGAFALGGYRKIATAGVENPGSMPTNTELGSFAHTIALRPAQ